MTSGKIIIDKSVGYFPITEKKQKKKRLNQKQ